MNRRCIVFCNAAYADRIAVAASRFLGVTAFAAEHRKLYWNGSIKVTMVIFPQMFYILALVILPVKVLLKSLQNRAFFRLWRQDLVLELQLLAQSCESFCV